MTKHDHHIMSKGVLILLFLGVLLTSCTENRKDAAPGKASIETPHESKGNHEEWQDQIQLDHGNKWKANDATTLGILNMTYLVETSSVNTVSGYHALGLALNKEKDQLIKRCTMKGASHDNLHIYLQPLLIKISLLNETETAAEGEKVLSGILQQLKMYHHYFA